ncbi:hypothetical protein PIB30_083672 [Stylosanthes scabra]|uniref:Aminotransferase-like plant mobile domain-containing protein n=1 Tax=Stylosanthes scabra TaxID=79078 RepID=A0ABU6UT38_9FABA|nr:hypothetical protein [Stylosanthes scabra]
MGFGALSNLSNYYLKQKVLKELFNRFDIYDNIIHAVAGEVEITTKKIGDALGISSTGKPFPDKVVPKELSDEDHAVFKFFQGKTQAQLGRLITDTPVDTVENKRLFMRAFLLFVQKTFLLATSSANVTPRAYPTLYDVENTKQRNWALHVHNFLLEELKKAKENKTKSIHGCCYALLIIYFHETQFGKNSREPIAQPPWIDYWNGRTLWDRVKQEKRDVALEQEETPIQQPEPQPQQQPPQDDVIDLSSCSDDEQPPHHMDVVHPLVPKVEKLQEDQPPRVLEQPSQSVVEVVPIYPTQEVIDVSSSSEDERPPLIPKTEQLDPYSPSAKIISEVLISMNRDEAPSLDLGIDPPLPQREEAPSFDLGIDPPLLTTQDLSNIEELDKLVQKAKDQFQTPQPIKTIENQKELEEKAVAWATVSKGGNEFETIFKLTGACTLRQ